MNLLYCTSSAFALFGILFLSTSGCQLSLLTTVNELASSNPLNSQLITDNNSKNCIDPCNMPDPVLSDLHGLIN